MTVIIIPSTAADLDNGIQAMHDMYKLPVPAMPTLIHQRVAEFRRILEKEVSEGADIAAQAATVESLRKQLADSVDDRDLADQLESETVKLLAMWQDWLCDLMVYCMSESKRLGLNPYEGLGVIFASNLTKLAEDGSVIRDADGKVCKGPNFRAPEPDLEKIIRAHRLAYFQSNKL